MKIPKKYILILKKIYRLLKLLLLFDVILYFYYIHVYIARKIILRNYNPYDYHFRHFQKKIDNFFIDF